LSSGIIVTEGVVDDEGIVVLILMWFILSIGDRVKFNLISDMEYNGKKL
jgi:hypothetical protein